MIAIKIFILGLIIGIVQSILRFIFSASYRKRVIANIVKKITLLVASIVVIILSINMLGGHITIPKILDFSKQTAKQSEGSIQLIKDIKRDDLVKNGKNYRVQAKISKKKGFELNARAKLSDDKAVATMLSSVSLVVEAFGVSNTVNDIKKNGIDGNTKYNAKQSTIKASNKEIEKIRKGPKAYANGLISDVKNGNSVDTGLFKVTSKHGYLYLNSSSK